jgi:tetratricopeptide (TPR) repeat protein
MRALRAFLALSVAVAAMALIVRGVVPRIECNREKGRMNREVRRFTRSGGEEMGAEQAHRNVVSCRRCLAIYPEDFQLQLLMGANQRILGNFEEALQSYERALATAERPEVYAQMAEIELERGRPDAARTLLRKAVLFDVRYAQVVDQPLRGEIEAEVLARQERLRGSK